MPDLRQGKYQKVIDDLRSSRNLSMEDLAALIGAHAFMGHLQEAQQLWRAHQEDLKGDYQIQARFFLGLAFTRISKFRKAKHLFQNNLREARSPEAMAFAFQGAGFYSYFRGNFTRALRWSQKSLSQAVKAKETYIEYLAMDLLGHTIVQAGERSQGLRLMQEANRLARLRKNTHFSTAFADARLVYEAEIGVRPKTLVEELEAALNQSELSDSYTRSNLILELARQRTLRGQFERAKDLLNREASNIYSFGNKRQEVMLQLRLGEIAYHQGDFHLMTHLLQSAKKTVEILEDKAFEIRLLGLFLKIPQDISKSSGESEKVRLLELSKEHSSRINRQILFRQGLGPNPKTPPGEDPLHDLLMLVKTEPSQARDISLALGYLGIYRQIIGISPGLAFLQVLDNGAAFVAGTREEIIFVKAHLSAQQIKLLNALAQPHASKERLIEIVWGYSYDPLRHDSLVHNAIGKLRKILGPLANWVTTTESGWMWDHKVQLLLERPVSVVEKTTPSTNENNFVFYPDDLNYRQLKALKKAPDDSGWSVGAYKQTFKVSTMTAFRDLTHLHQKGFVVRTGRGRACRYLLKTETEI